MESKYYLTVGLEIHAELKTKTKMFCDSPNDPNESCPNVNICPICMGHPGTLPAINKEAVRHVLRVGVALGGELADFTEFDRKNYFYPDIPKGYQLSQYKYPLVKGGSLNGVAITRVHLEEDTGTLIHTESNREGFFPHLSASVPHSSASLVDFNRAGVPLMELVTEPVIHSPKQASDFARELQLTLRYLGASDANMEKGEMRIEANISVRTEIADERGLNADQRGREKTDDPSQRLSAFSPRQSAPLGTKVEVKNLNSFRSLEKAIEYEILRQSELLDKGEKVAQETRGWDDANQKTFSQRAKEESHDYRYFPEPDLPKLYISEIPEFSVDKLLTGLPELPTSRRRRYERDFGIKISDIEVLVVDQTMGAFFDLVMKEVNDDKNIASLSASYITSDLIGLLKNLSSKNIQNSKDLGMFPVPPSDFAELMKMVFAEELSSRATKDILTLILTNGGNPRKIATERGLLQKSDEGELRRFAESLVGDYPKVVAEYRLGKVASLQFLIGQGMKKSGGATNPAVLRKILEEILAQ